MLIGTVVAADRVRPPHQQFALRPVGDVDTVLVDHPHLARFAPVAQHGRHVEARHRNREAGQIRDDVHARGVESGLLGRLAQQRHHLGARQHVRDPHHPVAGLPQLGDELLDLSRVNLRQIF